MDLAARSSTSTLVPRARALDPIHGLCAASLITVVLTTRDDLWVMLPVAAILLIALPRERVLRSPWLWATLFVGMGLRQLMTWHTLDDHTIAMTYWCGALALGLGARNPQRTLAASARLLIGLIFLFAAGWKILSGQFTDGSFFRYTLLFDDRFETVATTVGGSSSAAMEANVSMVNELFAGDRVGPVALIEGPRNQAIASIFTYWGLLIEGAVALLFLLPLRTAASWLRHGALVVFAATTYAVVPIGGFGALLLVLGSATVTTWRSRWAYYLGAGLLVVWAALWPLIFR